MKQPNILAIFFGWSMKMSSSNHLILVAFNLYYMKKLKTKIASIASELLRSPKSSAATNMVADLALSQKKLKKNDSKY